MKKLIALLLALMFLFSTFTVVTAEGETGADESVADALPQGSFTGILVGSSDVSLIVTNEYGTTLTLAIGAELTVPAIGSTVTVDYYGDLTMQPIATALTVVSEAVIKNDTGIVTEVNGSEFTILTDSGANVVYKIESFTVTEGEIAVGAEATVEYCETASGAITLSVSADTPTIVKAAEIVLNDTTNKKLSGTVTKLTSSRITIKTRKGKSWTFKRSSKTKESGKYSLKVGATVTITYDGYASKHPLAKKVKVTKAAPSKQYKTKSGTCEYFEGMMIGLTNGFEADVAYAKHSGKGYRGPGTKVKVTYYTKKGMNYAVKIKWKTK